MPTWKKIIKKILNVPVLECTYNKATLTLWFASISPILGQNLSNFFVDILVQTMKPKRHFEINWPLQNLQLLCFHFSSTSTLFCSVTCCFYAKFWPKKAIQVTPRQEWKSSDSLSLWTVCWLGKIHILRNSI